MTKKLIIKNLRDLRNNFSEFFSIFALSFLSLLVFSGLMSAGTGMKQEFDRWSKQSNLADVWVTVRGTDNLANLSKSKKVKSIQKQFLFNTNAQVNGGDKKYVQVAVSDYNNVSKPRITNGHSFNSSKEGVWVDANFAHKNGYIVGHAIKLSVNGQEKNFKIRGLVDSPNYIGYTGPTNDIVANHKKYGYILTNMKTMPYMDQVNQVLVTASSKSSITSLKKTIRDTLGSEVVSISSATEYTNVSKYVNKYISLKKISFMFCGVLILLVLLVTQTTMGRLVNNQRSVIGLFKALGLKKLTIVMHYIFYGLVTTVLGGLLGLLVGPKLIAPLILSKQEPLYNMPFWSVKFDDSGWFVLVVLVFSAIATAAFTTLKIVKLNPAQIMKPSGLVGRSSNIFEAITPLWNRLDWSWKWVLRDKSRAKSKELIGIVAVIGALTLLIASLGIQHSLSKTNIETFGGVFQYQNELKLDSEVTQSDISRINEQLDGDSQEVEQLPVNVQTSTKEVATVGNVFTKGIYLHIPETRNADINLNSKNGIYVTNLLANKLNIHKGQNIRVNSYSMKSPIIMSVQGIVNISTPQGIYMSSKTWSRSNQIFHPTSIYTGQKKMKNLNDNKFITQINSLNANLKNSNAVISSFQSVIMLMIIFSLFLAWFVLYNLGMLNFSERYREYATMRVLGFRLNEVRSVILKDNLLTWFVGSLIGVPIGILFLNFYVAIANTDTSEFFASIGVLRILIALIVILLNVLMVAFEVSRAVKKIDMSSALKSVE